MSNCFLPPIKGSFYHSSHKVVIKWSMIVVWWRNRKKMSISVKFFIQIKTRWRYLLKLILFQCLIFSLIRNFFGEKQFSRSIWILFYFYFFVIFLKDFQSNFGSLTKSRCTICIFHVRKLFDASDTGWRPSDNALADITSVGGGLCSTEVAFLLPTQQPWVRIQAQPRFFLFTA